MPENCRMCSGKSCEIASGRSYVVVCSSLWNELIGKQKANHNEKHQQPDPMSGFNPDEQDTTFSFQSYSDPAEHMKFQQPVRQQVAPPFTGYNQQQNTVNTRKCMYCGKPLDPNLPRFWKMHESCYTKFNTERKLREQQEYMGNMQKEQRSADETGEIFG